VHTYPASPVLVGMQGHFFTSGSVAFHAHHCFLTTTQPLSLPKRLLVALELARAARKDLETEGGMANLIAASRQNEEARKLGEFSSPSRG